MKLMDRVAAGLDHLGRKAAQAIDEGKLRMDIAGVRRRKDHAARDLGYLAYRQSKGEILAEGETSVPVQRIAGAEAEIAQLEAQLATVRASGAPAAEAAPSAGPEAPPPAADTGAPSA